jgi:diketogulonate reductase-like aldo/keto reductase
VFITTKFHPGNRDAAGEAEHSLARLGVDYVDLYLVHWPEGGPTRAWPGMERAHALGYARSIGVSNFGVDELDQVIAAATIPPVVDQIQFSPFKYRGALRDAAVERRVAIEAYSPLGTGRHLRNKTVQALAESIGRTPAQVLLRWCVQRQLIVITKSTRRERLADNAEIFDFSLSDEHMAELDALDRTHRTDRPAENKWW